MAKKIRRVVLQGRPRKPPPPPKLPRVPVAPALPKPGGSSPAAQASTAAADPPAARTISQSLRTNTREQQKAAMKWFVDKIRGTLNARGQASSSRRRISADAFSLRPGMPPIGQMFFYIYDAKWKDVLPYWDKFPLIIPIKYYSDGWLAINLHYLPPMLRGQLLDKLMALAKAYPSPRAFMKVSYELLKNIDKTKMYAPTIHRYLTSHVKSKIVKVDPEYWEQAARLPVQEFTSSKGAVTSTKVWSDSKKAINK